MPDKAIYEYAIIRVVPKVERGEYLNVGVILFSKKKKYLDLKYHIDKKRLSTFSAELDIDQIMEYLKSWELICQGGSEAGPIGQLELHVRFRWLTAKRSTIIQNSEVHPGVCGDEDLSLVLERLFERFVL